MLCDYAYLELDNHTRYLRDFNPPYSDDLHASHYLHNSKERKKQMFAIQQMKRNPFKRWVAVDLLFIVIFLTVALVVGLIKRESPDIWTGLYILGLIPLILSEFKEDLEEYVKWQQRNK